MVPTWQWSNTGSGVNQGFKRQITVRLVIQKTSHVLPRVWTWMYKRKKKKTMSMQNKSFFVEYFPWCPGNISVKRFLSFSHWGVTERKALYVSVQWMNKLLALYVSVQWMNKLLALYVSVQWMNKLLALYVSVQWMNKLFLAYCETRNRQKKTSADRLNVTHS